MHWEPPFRHPRRRECAAVDADARDVPSPILMGFYSVQMTSKEAVMPYLAPQPLQGTITVVLGFSLVDLAEMIHAKSKRPLRHIG